jgi:hypothetical protein
MRDQDSYAACAGSRCHATVKKERLISEPGSNWVLGICAMEKERKPHACGQVMNYVGDVEHLDTFRRDDCRALIGGLNRAPEMEQPLSIAVWEGRWKRGENMNVDGGRERERERERARRQSCNTHTGRLGTAFHHWPCPSASRKSQCSERFGAASLASALLKV